MMNSTSWYWEEESWNDTDPDEHREVHLCDRSGDNVLATRLSYLYYVMFALSVLGNGLVLLIIYRFERPTSVTNIFLLNLVVSDLIFTCSLPFWGLYHQLPAGWVFGQAMCKVVGSVYFLGLYSSVLFLTLLTLDRYLAVVYPLAAPRLRVRRYAAASCAAAWLLSGLACVKPLMLYATFHNLDSVFCEEDYYYPGGALGSAGVDVAALRSAGKHLQLFLFFLLPLAVVAYCYARIAHTVAASRNVTRKQTVRLIFAIVLLFFACWAPYNVVLVLHDAAGGGEAPCEEIARWTLGYALQVTRNMAYLYFCVSPVFYTFVGKKFRRHLRRLLAKRFSSCGAREHRSAVNLNSRSAPSRSTPNGT